MDLCGFAKGVIGDTDWNPPDDLLTILLGLDWSREERKSAEALVRWWYWEPRVPPAERQFYPGGTSRSGFLDWGEDLATVITADRELLARYGWSHVQLGEELRKILDAAVEIRELERTSVNGETGNPPVCVLTGLGLLQVQLRAYRGFQACPFADCVHSRAHHPAPHSGVDFHLTHLVNGTELRGPGLAWHLIAAHGFCGGARAPYRVDPEALVSLLERARRS